MGEGMFPCVGFFLSSLSRGKRCPRTSSLHACIFLFGGRYDRGRQELEEKLDEKTAQLIHLQRVTIEQATISPVKNPALAKALGDWGANQPPATEAAAEAAAAAATGRAATAHAKEPVLALGPPTPGSATPGSATPGGGWSGDSGGAFVEASPEVVSVRPSLLLSFPQYPRHPSAASVDHASSPGGLLLSGAEKLAEQAALVAALEAEKAATSGAQEAAVAAAAEEKKELEALLREKLERVVAADLDRRLDAASGGGGSGALADSLVARALAASLAKAGVPGVPPSGNGGGGGGGSDGFGGGDVAEAEARGEARGRAARAAEVAAKERALRDATEAIGRLTARLNAAPAASSALTSSAHGAAAEAEALRTELTATAEELAAVGVLLSCFGRPRRNVFDRCPVIWFSAGLLLRCLGSLTAFFLRVCACVAPALCLRCALRASIARASAFVAPASPMCMCVCMCVCMLCVCCACVCCASACASNQVRARCARLEASPVQPSSPPSSLSAEGAARLQGRCDALAKERKAVQTIMELKVNVLVNEVGLGFWLDYPGFWLDYISHRPLNGAAPPTPHVPSRC